MALAVDALDFFGFGRLHVGTTRSRPAFFSVGATTLGSIRRVTSGDFVHTEHVRFRDLDPMGHVNNAVFLTYIEQARVAFFAAVGAASELEDMNLIIARVEIDFKAPVRLGQEVEISVRASRFGTKSFDFDYVLKVDGEVVAEAKSVQVAYDYDRRETMPLPNEWRERLSPVAA